MKPIVIIILVLLSLIGIYINTSRTTDLVVPELSEYNKEDINFPENENESPDTDKCNTKSTQPRLIKCRDINNQKCEVVESCDDADMIFDVVGNKFKDSKNSDREVDVSKYTCQIQPPECEIKKKPTSYIKRSQGRNFWGPDPSHLNKPRSEKTHYQKRCRILDNSLSGNINNIKRNTDDLMPTKKFKDYALLERPPSNKQKLYKSILCEMPDEIVRCKPHFPENSIISCRRIDDYTCPNVMKQSALDNFYKNKRKSKKSN